MNLELQGTVNAMMLRGGLFSTCHLTVSCAFKAKFYLPLPSPGSFSKSKLEQETPTGASEVEEDMAGVGPEKLKLVLLAGTFLSNNTCYIS